MYAKLLRGHSKQVLRFGGVITKYTEICIARNPLNFNFTSHLEGATHQFTAAPLHTEAMAANIAGESRWLHSSNAVSQQRGVIRGPQQKLFLRLVLFAVQFQQTRARQLKARAGYSPLRALSSEFIGP